MLGGSCFISTKINDAGQIQHLNNIQRLTFGELSPRVEAIAAAIVVAKFESVAEAMQTAIGRLTDPQSKITASMLGDVERHGRTEVDHILGDLLLRRGKSANEDRSLLRIAYLAIRATTARARREVS